MFDNIMYIPRMKTRLLSEEPSGIKYFLINQIFKEIVNFLRIGKKQKWQKIGTDGLSLKQNIRNMLKFSIWGEAVHISIMYLSLNLCRIWQFSKSNDY